jgi:predicted permease
MTGGFKFHMVTPGYFRTMGIPLMRGRMFSASDRVRDFTGQFWLDSSFVIVVNETMAKRDFPDGNPIGMRVTRGVASYTIIGVVGDVKEDGLHTPAPAQVYIPFYQSPTNAVGLYFRTETDPLDQVAAVRERLSAIDADQPVELFETMDAVLADSMARQRFSMVLMAVFAALALALAAGGIFGVTSYAVARRTQEFGIRQALGARASGVFHLVLGEGLRLSLTGVAVGLVAALWLTRLIASELYGVTPTDPMTFVVVCAVLVAVALVASYVPARRATRADPMTSLRYE